MKAAIVKIYVQSNTICKLCKYNFYNKRQKLYCDDSNLNVQEFEFVFEVKK